MTEESDRDVPTERENLEDRGATKVGKGAVWNESDHAEDSNQKHAWEPPSFSAPGRSSVALARAGSEERWGWAPRAGDEVLRAVRQGSPETQTDCTHVPAHTGGESSFRNWLTGRLWGWLAVPERAGQVGRPETQGRGSAAGRIQRPPGGGIASSSGDISLFS